jgi:cell division protein FtsN
VAKDPWLASMISPTQNLERRQSPRTTINKLAYINFDSNNGAIVLNVSKGGLCFHSVAPIQRSETIRFWFSEGSHRIEVDGQLAWMDEKQKTGGLRFTSLSTEARLQVRDWMSQSITPTTAGARVAPSLSATSELPALNARRPDGEVARDKPRPFEVRSSKTKRPALSSGFSAGLVLGILVSTLAAAALLLRAYPGEFGDSLIQLGERLKAGSQTQGSPASKTASPESSSNLSQVKSPVQSQTRVVKPQPVKTEAPPVTATQAPSTVANATSASPVVSSAPPPVTLPEAPVEPEATDISTTIGTASKRESATPPDSHIENAEETRSYSTMYLEVGRFQDVTWADETTHKLEQLGFHATVVHKGHLLMSSYHVLVGPYSSDDQAEAAHRSLVSRGYTPRAYERGSRNFWFPSGLTFHGTHLPVGDCVVSWESYVTHATVKFEKDRNIVATAKGKWVERGAKYEWNMIVSQRNGDGSRTLLEIRFASMSRALVLGESDFSRNSSSFVPAVSF